MTSRTVKYEGGDYTVTISQKELEAKGVQPGGEFVLDMDIRPTVELTPRDFSPEERERRRAVIQRITGTWSSEAAAAFRKYRQELWATWKPRTW